MNSSTISILLNILLLVVEASTAAYLASAFFTSLRSKKFYFMSFVILVALINVNAFVFQAFTPVRVLIGCILYTLWIYLNYHATVATVVFTSFFLISLQYGIDLVFVTTFSSIYAKVNTTLSNPLAYYAFCYSSKLLQFLVVVLIKAWAKRRFQTQGASWLNWVRVLFFPLSTLLIAFQLLSILLEEPYLADKILICTILLLAADCASIFLLNYLERQQEAILDNVILRQTLKIESEHIQSLKELYTTQRKQTHDFNNQLSVLRSMAEQGVAQSEFSNYLNCILSIDFPSAFYINTHRSVVDVIISQKSAAAHNKKIIFDLRLGDLSTFPLPDDALVVVLTNLIDNAIEACEKIPDETRRKILLKMQRKEDSAYLYIENATSAPVVIQNNQIATTKSDAFTHGYGLKNTCTMLRQHGWMFAMSYREEGIFCFSAKISL